MKQGNIERVDKGWEKMFPILEEEMPQKKDKRRLWLLLLPICLAIITLGLFGKTADSDASNAKMDFPIKGNETNINENEKPLALRADSKAVNDLGPEGANIINQISDAAPLSTELSNQSAISKQARDIVQSERKTISIAQPERASNSLSQNVSSKTMTTKPGSPNNNKTINVNPHALANESSNQQTKKFRVEQSKPLLLSHVQYLPLLQPPTLRQSDYAKAAGFSKYSITETIPDDSHDINARWVSGINARYQQLHKLGGSGVEGQFFIGRQLKKWTLSLYGGVGSYRFHSTNSQKSVSELDDDKNAVSTNSPSEEEDMLVFPSGSSERETVARETINNRYLVTGIEVGFQLSNCVKLHAGTGILKYKNSTLTTDIPATYLLNKNSTVHFSELGIDYNITSKLSVTSGYRIEFKSLNRFGLFAGLRWRFS